MKIAFANRIYCDPNIMDGAPCIKGTRITASALLDMLADGATHAEILANYPYLSAEDISATLIYAK